MIRTGERPVLLLGGRSWRATSIDCFARFNFRCASADSAHERLHPGRSANVKLLSIYSRSPSMFRIVPNIVPSGCLSVLVLRWRGDALHPHKHRLISIGTNDAKSLE